MLGKEFGKLGFSIAYRLEVFLTFPRIELDARQFGDGLASSRHCNVRYVIGDVVREITAQQIFAPQVNDAKIGAEALCTIAEL